MYEMWRPFNKCVRYDELSRENEFNVCETKIATDTEGARSGQGQICVRG